MNKVIVIIPTLNGGIRFVKLVESLRQQIFQPEKILVVDSDSDDKTVNTAKSFGCDVLQIARSEFDHGATRQMGVEKFPDAEIIVFFTQDSILVDNYGLQYLIECFDDERIGAAYGRQIIDDAASLIGAHARQLNYPKTSIVKSIIDVETLGLKTPFISNSFAAYRRSALVAAGGFPKDNIFGEDMYAAAKMLMTGWKIAYCAEAQVYHYHDYNFKMEFKRYFDIGVFHARSPWIREAFGKLEGEGIRYIKSEVKFLLRKNSLLIPSAMIRSVLKFVGYRLGVLERNIPRRLKVHLSMNSAFWRKQPVRPLEQPNPQWRL